MTDEIATARGPVVVGVDGSPNAARALAMAARLATAMDLEVVAVHAVGLIEGARRDEVADEVQSWCADLATAAIRHRVEVLDGHPADVLLRVAAAEGASFVVVGSRGLGGHGELLLGSTSHQAVHHACCPVVVVPPVRTVGSS
jgi:nucleotide-binding universal stress UspA family protein